MPDSKQSNSAKLCIFGENAKFRGRPSVKLSKNSKNAKFDGRPMGNRTKKAKMSCFREELARSPGKIGLLSHYEAQRSSGSDIFMRKEGAL